MNPICLSIKQEETGKRIKQLLQDHGYKVKDIQGAMGFETPQAVYKWLSGKCDSSLETFESLRIILRLHCANCGQIIKFLRLLCSLIQCGLKCFQCFIIFFLFIICHSKSLISICRNFFIPILSCLFKCRLCRIISSFAKRLCSVLDYISTAGC